MMAALDRHVCPSCLRILLWDPLDDSTVPVRISADARTVSVGGPRPESTALETTTHTDPRNRAERRADAARARRVR